MRMALLVLAASVLGALVVAAALAQGSTPLLDYVSRPDKAYTWAKESETPIPLLGTRIRVNMTSQVWQGILWKHELDIIRPEKVREPATAILLITGGHGDAQTLALATTAANATGMPVAVLFDIPNQPLFGGKEEDALIAYTFSQFVKTGDKSWPLLFQMTKSAVRAMDTVQAIAGEWKAPITRFVVTGASKRGWTTWLTAAADKRVAGIAPMVYDNLNIPAQMKQQVADFGEFSAKLHNYNEAGLLDILNTPRGRELVTMVDPYTYRARLTMPKLIVNGSNDPYWTLGSANLYFPELPGDKHILYVPNAGHGLEGGDMAVQSIGAFSLAVARGRTLPALDWQYREEPAGLRLTMRAQGNPSSVSVWTAAAPTRDFRQATWTQHKLTAENGRYTYLLPRPAAGFAAIFGEPAYPGDPIPFWQSTTPRILGAARR